MPTRSKLTVMGMYNYNDTLFDNMVLPNGVDRDVAIMRILFDNAPLEVMLPHFQMLKEMIGYWSQSHIYKWTTLFNTTNLEYNPIWNVDANESETTEREYEDNKSGTFTESGTTSKDISNTKTLNTTTDDDNTRTLNTSETDNNTRTLNTQTSADNYGKLAGFNASTYSNVTNNSGTNSETGTIGDAGIKSETGTIDDDRTITETGTISDAGTEDGTTANSGSNSGTTDGTETVTITKRRTGNIGVTMTQQMIEAERNVAKFSIYEVISNDFKHEFCIMVY